PEYFDGKYVPDGSSQYRHSAYIAAERGTDIQQSAEIRISAYTGFFYYIRHDGHHQSRTDSGGRDEERLDLHQYDESYVDALCRFPHHSKQGIRHPPDEQRVIHTDCHHHAADDQENRRGGKAAEDGFHINRFQQQKEHQDEHSSQPDRDRCKRPQHQRIHHDRNRAPRRPSDTLRQ